MKSKDKLETIYLKIEIINKNVLKNKKFKLSFDKSNNYCLILKDNKIKFNTYDDVLACLTILEILFRKEENDSN